MLGQCQLSVLIAVCVLCHLQQKITGEEKAAVEASQETQGRDAKAEAWYIGAQKHRGRRQKRKPDGRVVRNTEEESTSSSRGGGGRALTTLDQSVVSAGSRLRSLQPAAGHRRGGRKVVAELLSCSSSVSGQCRKPSVFCATCSWETKGRKAATEAGEFVAEF